LRSFKDLTKHFTTRADDSHATPVNDLTYINVLYTLRSKNQKLVRFRAYYRIKPHAPPLVWTPVNSFEFQSCDYTLQVECLTCLLGI